MRFKEFLQEREQGSAHLLDGLNKIKEECSQFLSAIHKSREFMYRGMNMPVVDRALFLPHIKNRSPRDSSVSFNVMFNAGMDLAFGIELARLNSAFCYSDPKDTKEYGNCYFIFPKGSLQVIYSPHIIDSFVEDEAFWHNVGQKLNVEHDDVLKTNKPKSRNIKIESVFNYICEHSGFNIEKSVKNFLMNDDMLKEALADAGVNSEPYEFHNALEEIFKHWYRDDIAGALTQSNEILLHDSNGYWAVPRQGIRQMIEDDITLDGQSPEEFMSNFLFP